ncbi:MAG: phenylalanine--tRNA ligase subunit beta [Wenzhouxiangellaceae bacterium]|nr:phenylalanine--tRNA ligase subunit beta [Wenzhouxiangellaceae bacterium]
MNWLKQWVPSDLEAEQVADLLTGAGLEVDEISAIGEGLDGVVVGLISDCRPHPDADRLKVCEVDFGGEHSVTIVCGAPNARVGLKAPLATVGTTLPNGMKIKPARLRGIASNGMLCSAPELGVGEAADGLLELPEDAAVGQAVSQALGLPDQIIELDLTPNRADCLSIRGIAREFAALTGLDCREPVIQPQPATGTRRLDIELLDPQDCSRYVGRIIEGVDTAAATPAWMVQRLERCGLRSLGPIVDATNYVLLELGQPMHAFDLDAIEGGIRVRRAVEGDRITLLDGQQIEPDNDMLLICDHRRPLALAGIMGGADSAVGEGTSDILLESAWFNPASIIGKGRRLGLATDSAHRFERGVDPRLQQTAIERATQLIVEIAGGRAGPIMDVSKPEYMPETPVIELRTARVNKLLGTSLESVQVEQVLERLGMRLETIAGGFRVRPPSARCDLSIEVDLIEEIARLVGYDKLPSRAPRGRLRAIVLSERMASMQLLRASLQARGFQEILTWSFVSNAELERLSMADTAQPLANPLSQELAVLRTGLLPGLLRTASSNLRHQQSRLKLYEIGHVFSGGDQPLETERLALLVAGDAAPESWHIKRRGVDFFDLKGELEQLWRCLGHAPDALEYRAAPRDWLHPGQSAELLIDGELVGWAGQMHPAVAGKLGLEVGVFVAEMALLPMRERDVPEYRGLQRFPAVRRDLALIVPESVPASKLKKVSQKVAGALLEECIIFDNYQGKEIESGCKSLAIGLILRDVSRTLTDGEVDSIVVTVMESLKRECNIRLRG